MGEGVIALGGIGAPPPPQLLDPEAPLAHCSEFWGVIKKRSLKEKCIKLKINNPHAPQAGSSSFPPWREKACRHA